MERLPDVRLRPRAIGRHRENHALALHAGICATPRPVRLVY